MHTNMLFRGSGNDIGFAALMDLSFEEDDICKKASFFTLPICTSRDFSV